MSNYWATLQIPGIVDKPVDIVMNLDDESLAMETPRGEEIGLWPLAAIQMIGRDEGFTIKIHGVPGWLRTNDDVAIAAEIGLQWTRPQRRRCGCHRQHRLPSRLTRRFH